MIDVACHIRSKAIDLRSDPSAKHALKLWSKSEGQVFEWRNAPSKFHGLVAELLLQRTTAKAASAVYTEFVKAFPDSSAVARSEVESILHIIRPLGIHYRAKILKSLAVELEARFNGVPPSNYDQLIDLPGVGDYVASAYLLIHCDQRVAIADSNIQRIASRLTGLSLSAPQAKDFFTHLLPEQHSRGFSLDFLDLSMKLCRPNPWTPKCDDCPLVDHCESKALTS